MTSRKSLVLVPVCALALLVACSKQSTLPASPSAVGLSGTAQGASGETLKVAAPTPQSPTGGGQVESHDLTLSWSAVAGMFADFSPTYRVQVIDANGAVVYEVSGITGTSHLVNTALEGQKAYTWRARAEYQGAYGPWSSAAAFISPVAAGYIKGNELYDPLDNGKTVGTIVGPTHFVPGKGLYLEQLNSYISYELPQTLTEGEFSYLATNVRTHTQGGKTKLMAMAQGYDDITTNDRRFTFEKRSDGTMAFRLITHMDQVDTGPSEREFVQFNLDDTFFFKAEWRNNVITVEVRRDGPNGEVLYQISKPFDGDAYDPNPHVIYIGGPGGRAGDDSGSVPDLLVRQVWVSPNPRPAYTNK